MSIVDNELVGVRPTDEYPYPTLPTGEYLDQLIRKNIEKHGDGLWMTDASKGRTVKYSEMYDGMHRVASALYKRGFRANDSVLIMASNHLEVPWITFSCLKAGGSAACLTLNLLPADIRSRVTENQTKFILTDEDRAPRILEAVRDLDFVKEVFVIGQFDGCTPVQVLFEDDGQSCPQNANTDLDSLVWLMYSSGTTGIPKGIVHTQRNMNAVLQSYTSFVVTGKKFLFINLMINSGGMVLGFMSTVGHSHAIIMSNLSDDNLLLAIHENKPEMISCFPSQIAWLCRHPELEKFDVSTVRLILTGGSTINPIFEKEIFEKLPNLMLLNVGYGLSETGIVTTNGPTPAELATMDRKAGMARHIIGSCGKIIPYCRLKVVDRETGEKLGPGGIGEIVVQSPYMLKEYKNMPKETASSLQNGWFYTGDKGYYDKDGYVFVIGRYKELIKYRMAHVVPTNIEKHMLTHPAIEDCGVVGLPHDVHGELPLAFVVLRPGVEVTAEDLVQYTNERVMEEEKLRGGIRFIEKIPRNDLGKVIRPQLSKLLQA